MAEAEFLDLTDAELRDGLHACLGVQRFVEDVATRARLRSLQQLLDVAESAASPLTPAEVDEALAHHPRIGERAGEPGPAQQFSAAEQAASFEDYLRRNGRDERIEPAWPIVPLTAPEAPLPETAPPLAA